MKPLRKIVGDLGRKYCPSVWQSLDNWRARRAERHDWEKRIADVLSSPDNARLPRVANAGRVIDGFQVMHNGLKVIVNGYYGDGITRMLQLNRGCHEPQEEVVFDAIVRTLPPGAVMVEAGAYWSFYAMWFCREINSAKAFLIEPVASNLAIGKANFQLNGINGDFTQAYVGCAPGIHTDGTPILSVDSFATERKLSRLHVLHADIQGAEVSMLEGAYTLLSARQIDYLFISTHSVDLHEQCASFLRTQHYQLLASVDPEESHSVDGVLVACSPGIVPPVFAPPLKKPKYN